MTLAEIVKKARQSIGMSKAELARRAGVSYAYVAQIERGERVISADMMTPKLAKILEVLGVDPRAVIPKRQFRHSGIGWNMESPVASDGLQGLRSVPMVSKIAAGDPKDYTDGNYPAGFADRFVPAPEDLIDPQAFALEVEGDSMSPRFPPGTLVFCAPSQPLENGQPAVIRIGDESKTTCKIWRVRGNVVILEALNPNYGKHEYQKSEIKWAYPVVGSYRKEV